MSLALKTLTKEHSKAAACFDRNSQLVQDSQKTGHSFDFKYASILHICLQCNWTTNPSFLRADSQRGTAELTIACRKQGRVV